MTMRRKIMSWDKINLGDVVQGVWDNYNVFENQAKLKEKRKCLTATAR